MTASPITNITIGHGSVFVGSVAAWSVDRQAIGVYDIFYHLQLYGLRLMGLELIVDWQVHDLTRNVITGTK